MSWKDKKIVIMGDSITWGAYTDGNIWWQELGRLLGCDSVVGNGVPGSCFSVTSDYGPINDPMSERWKCLPTGADLYIIFGGTNDYGHTLADYREAIQIKCAEFGIEVIDTYEISGFDFSEGQDGMNPFNENVMGKSPYTVDGLHPNTEGHLKLAERIFPYIAKVI